LVPGATVHPGNFQTSGIAFQAEEKWVAQSVGSATGINIRLTITEGSELVVQLDTLSLAPHSQVTRVYDVPAKKLMVFAGAVGGAEATTRWTC
jgi:hypothetical protein